jgi:hypothetical protein
MHNNSIVGHSGDIFISVGAELFEELSQGALKVILFITVIHDAWIPVFFDLVADPVFTSFTGFIDSCVFMIGENEDIALVKTIEGLWIEVPEFWYPGVSHRISPQSNEHGLSRLHCYTWWNPFFLIIKSLPANPGL